MTSRKHEALTVTRFINEVLVGQLNIPLRQIVNDSTFPQHTGVKRPDILISEIDFTGDNDSAYIDNLVAYAEAKDRCRLNDHDWREAMTKGQEKAKLLDQPYFIVTNCATSVFYNTQTLAQVTLNKSPIRDFQTIDILRLIKNRLGADPSISDIQTNVDSISTISEAIFNKKLWDLATVYRGINFKNNQEKIDFTIGFIALEFYEEKAVLDGSKDRSKIYWSECDDENNEKLVASLNAYVHRLSEATDFREFQDLTDTLTRLIFGPRAPVSDDDVRRIYNVINTMRPLHGTGFDLFGAVYEMFASAKEKKEFGEYFTRRHYAHIFSKLLLRDEQFYRDHREFTVLDPACGTGGFLTESYKVLRTAYERSNTMTESGALFLQDRCFYGVDVRDDNIGRTRLNMFLVGDGHTNMIAGNTLRPEQHPFQVETFDYIITNPPYGSGTIRANTSSISTVRTEIAFLCRIRELLRVGGRACIIQPDGVLENLSFKPFRQELLETCNIDAIVSLPKFAFAPYTKEKTYAVFITKRSSTSIAPQTKPIWMYVIDNDGLANSDKRFPTKLRNNRNGWAHDEISGWVTTDGDEMPGLLEERWMEFDDSASNGTEWIDQNGESVKTRKGGKITISTVLGDKYRMLLPEYYLRAARCRDLAGPPIDYDKYQGRRIPVAELFEITGGTSGLTDEYLYSLLFHSGHRKYLVLTGSIDTESGPHIYRCPHPKNSGKLINTMDDQEGIHIVRKGKAGHVNYLPRGYYAWTDDAYVLTLRESCEFCIDLRWVVKTQMELFLEYSSSADNGTWTKEGFLKYATIDIPSLHEQRQQDESD